MPPEDLPKFYEALASGRGEFVNGSRLVYDMEPGAMRFLNLIANKFFSLALQRDSLGQHGQGHALRDEGARRRRLRADRGRTAPTSATSTRSATSTCCFGAARLNLKIVDLPVRYQRADVRRDEHQPLPPRLAAAADDGLRVLEVQGRAADTPRSLSHTVTGCGAQRWAVLAAAAVVAVAVLILVAQPLRSPWWTYADADASYTASALNLLLGEDVTFVDHPGLPLTEALAIASAPRR